MVKIPKTNKSKRKIAFSLIIAAIITINIIAGALIFLDIRIIKTPEVTIEIDLLEINSNEAVVQTTLSIANPNKFGLIIKDFEAITKTPDDGKIMHMVLDGGEIAADTNKTFSSTDYITFDGEIPQTLTTEVKGIVGLRFLGIIKKTLPVKLSVITSLGDVIKSMAIPIFHIKGEFGEITNDGLNFSTEIDIENPNSFDMQIQDVSITIQSEEKDIVGEFVMAGDLIAEKSSTTLNGEGKILLEILNSKTLIVNISTSVGVMIAGINEFIDFSTEAEISIPQINDIFTYSLPTEAFINADMKLVRLGILNWGFISYMELEIKNPNKIGLILKNVVFSIYRIDDGNETLIGDCSANESEVKPEDITIIPAEIFLPLKSLLKGKRFILPQLPEGVLVVVRGNITIPGLDQAVWIGVSGYQDMHPFR